MGLYSPSSGNEVVHDSPEEYEEEDLPSPSPSPATKTWQHMELEKDLDEISTETSQKDEYDPTDSDW